MNFEFINGIFTTFRQTDLAQYAFIGSRALAVTLFVAVALKKYAEGATNTGGATWGLRPEDLIKGLITVTIVLVSPEILSVFDLMLLGIQEQFELGAPPIQPLFMADAGIEIAESEGTVSAVFNLLVRYFGSSILMTKLAASVLGVIFWALDYMIYPIFLAERFFMLGVLQVFFPFVMALAIVDHYRELAYGFFKLYAAVYLLVPAFFLVNIFSTQLYVAIQTDLLDNIFGIEVNNALIRAITTTSTTAFVLFIKWKLYKRSSSFIFKLFRS